MTLELYPFQREGVRQIEKWGGRALLADEQGLGKAQPLTANILTPTGYVKMGDAYVGMPIMGADGAIHKVTGVFPQGVKKVYRITTADGCSTLACEDHLWSVRCGNDRNRGTSRVLTTKEIKDDLLTGQGYPKWAVPMTQPLSFAKLGLPLHPYLVGYLIANGCLKNASVLVSIPDEETLERLESLLPKEMMLRRCSEESKRIDYRIIRRTRSRGDTNPVKDALIKMGLMWKGAEEKEIPKDYLLNSPDNRLLLLQGLMDGDGSTSQNGVIAEYSTVSSKLAEQMVFLVQSFGGRAKNTKRQTYFAYKGERKAGRPSYRINISLPKEVMPFLLNRKGSRYKPRTKYQPSRSIKSIEFIGKEKCQCISTSAPDRLYLTDDMIVTHNTVQALATIDRNPSWSPVVIVCPSSLKYQWRRLALEHIGLDARILRSTTSDWGKVKNEDAVIINPDILKDWVWVLQKMRPQFVIADEVQWAMNPEAARTWALGELVKDVPHFLPMSGTPIMNRPIEFWSVLNMLDPHKWFSRHVFGHKYCRPRRNPFDGKWKFTGCTNADELNTILRETVMIRRLKRDVLKDLPDKMYNTVTLELSRKEMKEYNLAKTDIRSWLRANSRSVRKDGKLHAEALQRINTLRQLTADLKMPHVIEWVKDFLQSDEKLILFGVHRRFVEKAHETFGKKAVMVYGGVSDRERDDRVMRFNTRDDCNLFVGNSAAYTGWSAKASHIALGEFPWRPADVAQMVDRAHGINRGVKGVATSAWFLAMEGTIDVNMVKALRTKENDVSSVLDGEDWKTRTDSVFDEVLAELMA